ncbi:glycosyltransferase family 2 protein [Pseudoalteromonas maricaloris]|uniref:Glycosyltransferase family 2 protein n=1 Tax=Pseudoalteromonas maricaloris TaxID=184924 RepID=A0A8I2H5G8_9GAMM|nr:glycosyltransferase family 2 protein [Pseudoalteromonas maricaloris]NLR23403.1 glycosyltransferase family 2 protein [Pseudoalteromonas maricaloris]WOX29217.1 glycosyltransferase family 2 protein [Pseudoalteromonas maricaloris]
MLVSVVIPIYNMSDILNKCLDSISSQSYENIEVICVNDCSTDSSLEIIQEYVNKDARFRCIDLKTNIKQGGARNAGISHASGDYIFFIDSDDWAEENLIEELASKVKNVPYEIIYCDYSTRFNKPELDKVVVRNTVNWDVDNIYEIKKKLLVKPSPIWSALYSADFFTKSKIRFPEGVFYEDNYVVPLLLCKAERIKKVQKCLMNYNMKNVSVTRTFNNDSFFDRLKTAKLLHEKVSSEPEFDMYRTELDFYIFEIFLLNSSIGCYRKFYPVRDAEAKAIIDDYFILNSDFVSNPYYIKKVKSNFFYRCYTLVLFNSRWVVRLLYSIKNFLLFSSQRLK